MTTIRILWCGKLACILLLFLGYGRLENQSTNFVDGFFHPKRKEKKRKGYVNGFICGGNLERVPEDGDKEVSVFSVRGWPFKHGL